MSWVMSASMPTEFRTETLRTLVAIGQDGEIAVALRDALPREMVVVLDARPDEALAAVGSCAPYPWAVVCDTAAAVPNGLGRKPILVFVRAGGAAIPAGAVAWQRFGELVTHLRSILDARVGGMRLVAGLGVEMPNGVAVRSASLQALVSAYPSPLTADAGQFRSAARILASHGVQWRPRPIPAEGGIRLAPTGAA